MKGLLVVLAAVGAHLAFATKFPTYIEQCSRSDPRFDECALRSANRAVKHLVQGDPVIGLPALVPVKLQPMRLNVTDHVTFDLTNGFSIVDDVTVTAVQFDFQQKSLFLSLKLSRATWYVDYEARGTVQDRPLHEKGQANITYDGLRVNATLTLDLKTVDGKRYLEASAGDATTLSTSYAFRPYNKQTTGQPRLSDDQVQEVAELYKRSILAIRREAKKLANRIIPLKLNAILKLAPFDEIFLP